MATQDDEDISNYDSVSIDDMVSIEDTEEEDSHELKRRTYYQLKSNIHILDITLWTRIECAIFVCNSGLPEYEVSLLGL
jgi:hypothetical protein